MTIIQFQPFASLVEPAFWHALTNLKIDVLKLADDHVPVTATYTSGRTIVDRETGKEIALGCNLTLAGDAFSDTPQCVHQPLSCKVYSSYARLGSIPPYAVPAHGIVKNYNTIEDFKAADKTALFNEFSDEVRLALILGAAYSDRDLSLRYGRTSRTARQTNLPAFC